MLYAARIHTLVFHSSRMEIRVPSVSTSGDLGWGGGVVGWWGGGVVGRELGGVEKGKKIGVLGKPLA